MDQVIVDKKTYSEALMLLTEQAQELRKKLDEVNSTISRFAACGIAQPQKPKKDPVRVEEVNQEAVNG